MENLINQSISCIKKYTEMSPSIAVVLGSGLGNFADTLHNKVIIMSADIPHFPTSTVKGHQGCLVFGKLSGIPVLALQGRTHFYEGYHIREIGYVVKVMSELSVNTLLVTNAAGGLNPNFAPGEFMVVTDQINWMFQNPLRGSLLEGKKRWLDLWNVYDSGYISIIEKTALELGIPIQKGVLIATSGPSYETTAEVRMARRFGADAVSMSTIPEVLVARSYGIKVAGISCITNLATGLSNYKLSHDEVTQVASEVNQRFQQLMAGVIPKLMNK